MVLGTSSLIASSRADKRNQNFTAIVSAVSAPVFVTLAGYMLKYSTYIKNFCSQHKAGASYLCSGSMSEGLYQGLCRSNELGVEATYQVVLLSTVTLVLQSLACSAYAALIYVYRDDLTKSSKDRQLVQGRNQTTEDLKNMTKRREALLKRRAASSRVLVYPQGFVSVHGLMQVWRGHRGGINCVKLARYGLDRVVFSGGQDATVRVWELRTGQPITVLTTAGPVSSLDVVCVRAGDKSGDGGAPAQQRSTSVKPRTAEPSWASAEDKFVFPNVGDPKLKMLTFTVYGWVTKDQGDVILGSAAIDVGETFGSSIDKRSDTSVTMTLPLVVLRPDAASEASSSTQAAGALPDLEYACNRPAGDAATSMNLLSATEIERRAEKGHQARSFDNGLRYRAVGSVKVCVRCQASKNQLEVQILAAQCAHTRLRARTLNPYCLITMDSMPLWCVLAATGKVIGMYDVASQVLVQDFVGHTSRVTAVVARRLGGRDLMFSGSLDKTARMWEVTSGSCLRVFAGHQDAVTALYVAPETKPVEAIVDLSKLSRPVQANLKLTCSANDGDSIDLQVCLGAIGDSLCQLFRLHAPCRQVDTEIGGVAGVRTSCRHN